MLEYEYMLRLIIAGALGALIGLEREKRFKEAGLRTHFLVAIGSAVFMIVSKYAFYDVIADDIILDPSRVAAAIPSGIGFLGAGMILIQRTSIQGLTTAAGIWATAGIGLAIGGGMYGIGIFSGLLVIVGLEFLKRLFTGIIPKIVELNLDVTDNETIQEIIEILTQSDIEIKDYKVKVKKEENQIKYHLLIKLQSQKRWKENEIIAMLQKLEGISSIKVET
ncbi:MAG TPA: MgtC/SapB family protein [Pseudogracilibacillus sp.]|nr:MgtC/SapB family protein [Pseudogracilibacillus sp.]